VTAVAPVPDLLRRFVPTPFQSYVETAHGLVHIRSSHEAFLYLPRPYRLSSARVYECVLIHDSEVPSRSKTLLLKQGELVSVLLAEGGHLHLDTGTRELFGFISHVTETAVIIQWIERLLSIGVGR
jgi:hypothetical protein